MLVCGNKRGGRRREYRHLGRFQVIEGRITSYDPGGEGRDTEHAIRWWHQESPDGIPPDLASFDFHRLQTDWGFRFLISGDKFVASAVFIAYGLQLARLLSLPEKPDPFTPILRQIPARYRDLFIEGCAEVLLRPEPVRFSGAIQHGGAVELYRAAFMPLEGRGGARPLIYGTFNRRGVPSSAVRGASIRENSKLRHLSQEQPERK